MIEVFSYRHSVRWQPERFNELLERVSSDDRKMTTKYQRWQDREAHLIGRLMWNLALKKHGLQNTNTIEITEYGRPVWPIDNGDANISHSGEWVVLAVADSCNVGIDIEKKNSVDINEFRNGFSGDEWDKITSSDSDQLEIFYRLWTSKEAAIKAEGKGWSNEADAISWNNNIAIIKDARYMIVNVDICSDYSCHFAFSKNVDNIICYTELQKL